MEHIAENKLNDENSLSYINEPSVIDFHFWIVIRISIHMKIRFTMTLI